MSNENKQNDERAVCEAALNARGDDKGQGLDPFWSSAFREGWQARALDGRVAYDQLKADYAALKYLCARAETAAAEAQVELKTLRATQQATTGEERAALDKWKIVDGDCREGDKGLITYHAEAFKEGLAIARATARSPVAGSAGQAPTNEELLALHDTEWAKFRKGDSHEPPFRVRFARAVLDIYAATAPSLATDAGAVDQRHVGDSNFEGWYQDYATRLTGNPKQTARDAYAAGMGDTTEQRMSDAARDAEDAARYRWLKANTRAFSLDMGGNHRYDPSRAFMKLRGPSLDDAFDAARKAEIERLGGEA